jgi:hypothetical protein
MIGIAVYHHLEWLAVSGTGPLKVPQALQISAKRSQMVSMRVFGEKFWSRTGRTIKLATLITKLPVPILV